MELNHEFRVDESPERAWEVLTDIPTIAPCLPGAELQDVEGDEYRGVVKIKLGPISAKYKGVATFVEKDDAAHRAVLRAEGRDTRGQGNAKATITAQLAPDGDGTRVTVDTDLAITGRVAQFGRGVLADVSSKLLGQFADCLATKLGGAERAAEASLASSGSGGEAAAGPRSGPAAAGGPSAATAAAGSEASAGSASGDVTTGPRPSRPVEPVDLLDTAGVPVAKRVAPLIIGALATLFLLRRRSRRRRRQA